MKPRWVVFVMTICTELTRGDENIAFVSSLSSESYLLAAKVLGYVLRDLHPHIPYVILATEDISNATFDDLRGHNIDIRRVNKIDTPYIEDHTAIKYQYSKLRAWSLTSFSSIVHLDLDVLPLRPIDSLFKCGHFCAAVRHSDMFNSGVFVLRPDIKVYEDMVAKSALHNYSSYDGGDQGFLNTYFSAMKYGPLFAENNTELVCDPSPKYRVLSAAFNYDIAMFYLNDNVQYISPAIIHYTMGPMKPWRWWSYPLFDLNTQWLRAREVMEETYHESNEDLVLPWVFLVSVICLALIYQLMHLYVQSRVSSLSLWFPPLWAELRLAPPTCVALSLVAAFHSVPEHTHPFAAWTHFYSCFVVYLLFTSSLYASLRRGRSFSFSLSIKFICLSSLLCLPPPLLLLAMHSFYHKVLLLVVCVPSVLVSLVFLLSRFLIGESDQATLKYELVSNKI